MPATPRHSTERMRGPYTVRGVAERTSMLVMARCRRRLFGDISLSRLIREYGPDIVLEPLSGAALLVVRFTR